MAGWNDGSGYRAGSEANNYSKSSSSKSNSSSSSSKSSSSSSSSKSSSSSGNRTVTQTLDGVTTTYEIDSSGRKVSGSEKTSTGYNPYSSNGTYNASSTKTSTSGYGSGNKYDTRETEYTWNDNGNNVVTHSAYTNYQDALKEAQASGALSNNASLKSALTYYKSPKDSSEMAAATAKAKEATASQNLLNNPVTGMTDYGKQVLQNNVNTAIRDLYNQYTALSDNEKAYLKDPNNQASTGTELIDLLNQIDTGAYDYLKNTNTGTYTGTVGSSTGAAASNVNLNTGVNNLVNNLNTGPYSQYTTTAPNVAALVNQYYQPTKLDIPEYTGLDTSDIQELYDNIVKNMESTQNNYLNALESNYNAAVADQNDSYNAQARANYLNYLASRNNAKLSLASSGAKGGLGQTILANIANNYATNQNTAATENDKTLRDLLNNYNTTYADTANSFQSTMASLQQNMIGYLQSAAEAENSYNQWVAQAQIAQTNADREYAMSMAQAALDQYNSDRAAAQEAYEFSQQMQYQLENLAYSKEQDALNNAYTAAANGDFSQLKALGFDTTNLEKQYAAELLSSQLDNQYTQAQINKLLSPTISRSGSGSSGGSKEKNEGNPPLPEDDGVIHNASTTPLDIITPDYLTALNNSVYNAETLQKFAKLDELYNSANSKNMNNDDFERLKDQLIATNQITQSDYDKWVQTRQRAQ